MRERVQNGTGAALVLSLAAATVAMGCNTTTEHTGLVVEVRAVGLVAGTDLDQVVATMGSAHATFPLAAAVAGDKVTFPFRFGVAPQNSSSDTVTITVVGQLMGADKVQTSSQVGFVKNEKRLLIVTLYSSCVDKTPACAAGTRCVGDAFDVAKNNCLSNKDDASKLPPFVGGGSGGAGGDNVDAAVDNNQAATDTSSDVDGNPEDVPTADARCAPATHLCGDDCVDNTSVMTCGTRCTPCPMPANADQATCDGKSCGLFCKTDYHLCGNACVSNRAPETCGVSCVACTAPTGGTATCDGMACGGTCLTGQKLCSGACIPAGQACANQCPSGTHNCNGLCLSDDSTSSCGPSACTACGTPANGSAACDGHSCGVTCSTGYKKCSDNSCVPADGCCVTADCPAVSNGSATCGANHACMTACNGGFHLCGSTCVSNASPNSCGASSCTACTPPTGGTATCDGASCGATCPTGTRICAGACVADSQACGNMCPSGTHNCGGQCLADTSVNSCGAGCSPCPAPQFATATCSNPSCGWACNAGYKPCAGACIPNSGCCTATECPGVTNGNAVCNASHVCAISCSSGYHGCNGVCADNNSAASCGTSACTPCPAPAGGLATCDGTSCGAQCPGGQKICAGDCILSGQPCMGVCPAGTHNCSGQCLANSSPNSCGTTSCAACPGVANGSATCSADGHCGLNCNNTYRMCNGACISSSTCCTTADCSSGQTCLGGTCQTPSCDGTSGQWDGCRGSGCSVCAEKLTEFPRYIQHHPSCTRNDGCAGQFFTCNAACPAPSDVDRDPALCSGSSGGWAGCRGSGCSVCAEKLIGFPHYFQNHLACAQNDGCAGQFFTCNALCPAPSDADR